MDSLLDMRDEFIRRYGSKRLVAASKAQAKAQALGMKVCPTCKGDGDAEDAQDGGVDEATEQEGPCKTCGGTGMVPKGMSTSAIEGKDMTPTSKTGTLGKQKAHAEPERAFVIHAESGRTVISAPLREIAMKNDGFTYLKGRFVEADTPNGNGALWTTEDLQLGEATVAGGPLNWLHQENKIIGTLLDGQLVSGREAAAEGVGNHIVSNAAVWRFLFPKEADTIERAAASKGAYFSMECLSRQVACIDSPGRPGCGEVFSYADYDGKRACAHLNERSSVRRFVDPLFLGGAIIVPPVQPGWAKAEVDVMRQAAALAERQGLADDGLSRTQAESLATAILTWANR